MMDKLDVTMWGLKSGEMETPQLTFARQMPHATPIANNKPIARCALQERQTTLQRKRRMYLYTAATAGITSWRTYPLAHLRGVKLLE
jgi:hypothetical protein